MRYVVNYMKKHNIHTRCVENICLIMYTCLRCLFTNYSGKAHAYIYITHKYGNVAHMRTTLQHFFKCRILHNGLKPLFCYYYHTCLQHYSFWITTIHKTPENFENFRHFRKIREFPENPGISENVGENFRDFGENFFSEFRKFQNCWKLFLQISCFL
jgi:hypothetical protein